MFNHICKSGLHLQSSLRHSLTRNLYCLQNVTFSSSTEKLETTSNASNQDSFTVSYLINSLGFPPEKALSASRYMNFEKPDKPDAVLAFLRNQGFTETQISFCARKFPPLILCDPEKILLPKFEFFYCQGASKADVAKILMSNPTVMKRSLDNQIIPSFSYFLDVVQSQKNVISLVKRFAGILCVDLQAYVAPNVELLRDVGISASNIAVLLTYQPRALTIDPEKFSKVVEEVQEMGFNPQRLKFLLAVHALRAMSKSTWGKKVELYKSWGWSEVEIFEAFGRHPWCMMASEDKIAGVMDYLVNKMGWEPSLVAKRPGVISLSLKKRIIPRCLVYQVMLEKGLVKKAFSIVKLLEAPDAQFFRSISKYNEEHAPELLRLYKEMLNQG